MLTINPQPAPPHLPQFSDDMEAFLNAAARTRQVRRTTAPRAYLLATASVAAVIIAVVIGLVVSRGGSSPNGSPGPVQLASFSVSNGPGGVVQLALRPGQLRNPGALRQALANAGVPALVTADQVCYVPGPSSILTQVLSAPQHHADGSSIWTITKSAIPRGVELSVGYFHVSSGFGIHVTLVPEHGALTCTAGPPTPPHR